MVRECVRGTLTSECAGRLRAARLNTFVVYFENMTHATTVYALLCGDDKIGDPWEEPGEGLPA